jgi:N-glycosylase/DNA lyase
MGLIKQIEKLKEKDIAKVISNRIKEFGFVEDLFGELCFCLMTANFQAEKCVKIQREIGEGIRSFSEEDLKKRLKEMGHRFWPQRAERIVLARGQASELARVVAEGDRDWLVKNIKGIGMKEASHFLRNVGFCDVAIIDFHVADLLKREGIIEFDRKKGGLSKSKYIEIENVLRGMAKRVGLTLAELDLYLWYIETGKVIK